MRRKYDKVQKKNIVTEIILTPVLCLILYVYCVVMLLIISFIIYSYFSFSLKSILVVSGIITVLFLLIRIICLFLKIKKIR